MKQPLFINRQPAQCGFTLLELMLVMALMGLAATYVVFNVFGVNQSDQLKKEAQRLQVLVDMASDYAVLNQQQLGIRFEQDEHEYYFVHLNEEEVWQKITDEKLYEPHVVAAPFTFNLNLDDLPWDAEDQLFDREVFDESFSLDEADVEIGREEDRKQPPPQVLIMSSGEITPFTLTFNYEPDFGTDAPVYYQVLNQDVPPLTLDGPMEQPPL